MTTVKKALLIRLDKIGDLICTLPADQLSVFHTTEAEGPYAVHWMISKGLDFVPRNALPIRQRTSWNKKFRFFSFIRYLKFLREEKFDLAISFQAPWWVSFGLWLACVPVRAGVKSQWHSFLFLNKALRQRRSLAEKHEAEYNFDLVEFAIGKSTGDTLPILKMKAPQVWKRPEAIKNYFVLHPGMAGSAKNWPQEKYIQAVEKLFEATEHSCVLTGQHMDEPYLSQIKSKFADHPRFYNLQNQISSEELLDVLCFSEFVLAPSTGVLHLAAALGKKSLGIYSPLTVQHPRRWAARGPEVHIFCPPESSANDPDCMNLIKVEDVVSAAISTPASST